MEKNFAISKYIKKLFVILGVLLVGLTLASCDSSSRMSKGNLDLNATYATSGNYSITVGDLYEQFRYNYSTTYLEEKFDEQLYKNEMDEVKNNIGTYKERLLEEILTDIFSTSDKDTLEEEEQDHLEEHMVQYVDTMAKKGLKITKEQIEAGLNKYLADQDTDDFQSVYPNYYIKVAKWLAAKNALFDELSKKEDGSLDVDKLIENRKADDAKVSEADIIDYYKDNYANQGDVKAILVRFVSNDEAKAVLQKFGIKSYNNYWYQIDLPEELTDDVYASKTDYDEYYENKSVSGTDESGTSSIEETGAGFATILRIFAEVYNYVYTFRNPITFTGEVTYEEFANAHPEHPTHLMFYYYIKSIIDADADFRLANIDAETGEINAEKLAEKFDALVDQIVAYNTNENRSEDNGYTVLSNKRLNGYNSSLATYVYETLQTEADSDDELFTRYTSSARSYGSYYFLLFKISQEADEELYKEEKDADGNTTYNFEGHEELLKEIVNELVLDKITDTYITEKYEARVKDAKFYIYDAVMELEYMQTTSTIASSYEKTKKKNKDNIAMVKYNGNELYLSVEDFYNSLEPVYGPQTALVLLFNEYIKGTDEYKSLESKYNDYVESLKLMLNYFANGYYSSYGYDSTLGKFNFLRLLYQSTDTKDIVYNHMMVSDAKSKYFADFTKLFDENNFLAKMKQFEEQSYNDYYNLSATQIKIYTDIDEDGKADELDENSTLYAKAQEFLDEVIKQIGRSTSSYTDALSAIISTYNKTSRYDDGASEIEDEYLWAKYRKLGFCIETGSISVSNSSENDEVLMNLIETYYKNEMDPELGLTTNVLTSDKFLLDDNLSLLLLTSGTTKTSAKYEEQELIDKLYKDIPTIFGSKMVLISNIDYADDKASLEALKVYVYDYLTLGEVNSLPAETDSYLDAYLLPLLQRYASSANQSVISLHVLGTITFANNNAERNETLNNNIEISKRSLDSYTDKYAYWWNFMESEVK